jgi:pilus assembly protein CpaC
MTLIGLIQNARRPVVVAATLLALTMLAPRPAATQGAEDIAMTVGKSIVIDYPADIRQVSTTDPEIADFSVISTREVLVNAKGLGSTTIVIWTAGDQRMFYNVTVSLDVEPLRRILRETFPGETIDVRTSGESVSLNGMVTTQEVAERAAALASVFAMTVVNNLQLPAPGIEQQVLLRVKFATLDRQRAQQYGVNFFTNGALNVNGGFVNSGARNFSIGGIFPTLDDFQVAIQALQQQNILQILAEPNLVTSNGTEASFLVGGEFPIPVLQGGANSGAVTIQYREFGIRLRFTPTVTANDTIKLTLNQEVSSLDLANGLTIAGFFIPALSTRRAESFVELGEGQSFVVAGLLSNEERDQFSQIPVISKIPILGNLFKSREERKQQTELVMLVTPEITLPLNPNDPKPEVTMPNEFLDRVTPEDLRGAAGRERTTTARR